MNTSVDSVESIESIRRAPLSDEGDHAKVCFGTNATVVTVAPYGCVDYCTPVPLIISPSDKTEKGKDLCIWLERFLHV